MAEVEPFTCSEFLEFIDGKIARQTDRDLKFLLRKAVKYAGGRKDGQGKERPRKFQRYLHLSGALSVQVNRENRADDDEDNDKDGLRRVRKLYKADPDKFGRTEQLLEKAKQRRLDKKKEKEEKGQTEDDEEDDDGDESEDWC